MLRVMWLVAQTHQRREKWACENITRQGGVPYLPMIVEKGRPACLFPGYVFVQTEGRWRYLLSTFGVHAVVLQGAQPAQVAEVEIVKLKAREGADGFVLLPHRPNVEEPFERGLELRVKDGAFSGHFGIYEGSGPGERERVLLEYMGRKTPVLLPATLLEVA